MLDMICLLNGVPSEYMESGLDELDIYFAMAKGLQSDNKDLKALPLKKWFNTNYHYIMPLLDDNTQLRVVGEKPFIEYREAKSLGIETKPVLIGPLTFLKLSRIKSNQTGIDDFASMLVNAYQDLLVRFEILGVQWLQIDEPILVTDLTPQELALFKSISQKILSVKKNLKVLLQTYFGAIEQSTYQIMLDLNYDAIGLDFIEGRSNLEMIESVGFPSDKILFAGVVNGKNIWINDYRYTMELLKALSLKITRERIVLNTSCSLLHVPYSLKYEYNLSPAKRMYFAFAEEKLNELTELKILFGQKNYRQNQLFLEKARIFSSRNSDSSINRPEIKEKVAKLNDTDFRRQFDLNMRERVQRQKFNLPLLPTTTIGSFPQTTEIRKLRQSFRKGLINREQYESEIKAHIAEVIHLQEEIGLDVIVHGEYERNDMVEYFAENLSGFLFTENGWVQSYGTRCVKPPVIFGDISRSQPITVKYITYAQSLTGKTVKGMLTGPVTILNWSFQREDLSSREVAYQIALAIRQEVLDLEAAGIRIIQIDEAAFREKLPLHKNNWAEYFDWALKAFRLTNSGVRTETQIHTHMCYSEFGEIIDNIIAMDADVFTFEAARSDFSILKVMRDRKFFAQTGPGVYDIHSPRIPSKDEIKKAILTIAQKIDLKKIWINPDCGLKTRNLEEVVASLKNMVRAALEMREEIQK